MGNLSLLKAAHGGDAAKVQELLNQGADVNEMFGEGIDMTALMIASAEGHLEVVKVLLANGADVNFDTKSLIGGTTALYMACYHGRVEVMKALLARGADVNARSRDGGTALMMASNKGPSEAVKALLAKGADVNAKKLNGKPVLHFADNDEIRTLLMQAAAKS